MEFPSSLNQAVLLKRHKRFLAEVIVNNQEHRVIYCPNVGAMSGCDILGSRIWFSHSNNPRRKFPDTWELIEVDVGHLVCINTQYTPHLIEEALKSDQLKIFQDYAKITMDPPMFEEYSFDILLEKNSEKENEECYIMIQTVTLGDEIHRGFFPDAPSERGIEQLKGLMLAKQKGYRAVLIFCALHTGIHRLFPADHIDPDYGSILRQALIAGVEIVGYRTEITLTQVKISTPLEICVPVRMMGSWKSLKSNKQ